MMFKKIVMPVVTATALVGCGSSNNNGSNSDPVSANFVLGLVDGAMCEIFEVDATGTQIAGAIAGGLTILGTIDFGDIGYEGTGLIECSGGTYEDEATGLFKEAGATHAVVSVIPGSAFTVSPLTEIAYQLAMAEADLGTALSTHNTDVADAFGIDADITTTIPTDIRTETLLNNQAGRYATALALISQLDANADTDAGQDVDVVGPLAADFIDDGELDEESIEDLSQALNDLATSDVADLLNEDAVDAIGTSASIDNVAGTVSITGEPRVGETLTASATDDDGTQNAAITYEWFANGETISGETSSTLLLNESQGGAVITVVARYIDDEGFQEEATSAPTEQIPENDAGDLAVSGDATVGGTLTASLLDENGTTNSIVEYQWLADGSVIDGATSETYSLTLAEVGASITVTATYTDDDGYTESIAANPTAAVRAQNIAGGISITGDIRVNSVLTATVSDQNGTTNSTITYQWLANDENIDSATGQTYLLTASEIGAQITVSASYNDDDGYSEAPLSEDSVGPILAPNVPGSIAIEGSANQGETLVSVLTDQNGTVGSTISYQWLANNINIAGATGANYTLTANEVGAQITVSASYIDDDQSPETPISAPIGPIIAANQLGSVVITGMATEGQTLTAAVTDGNGASGPITYEWSSDLDGVLQSSTNNSYTLTSNEVDEDISVTATYTDDDAYDEAPISDPVGPVVAANSEGSVAISGAPEVGAVLTATVTDENGASNSPVTYEWTSDVDGILQSSTASTYTLTANEVGQNITVTATYMDDDDYDEAPVSDPIGPIVAANVSGSLSITGTPVEGETLTASLTDENGTTTSSISYQWFSLVTPIAGATNSTYNLTSNEVGELITVSVDYTDDDGYTESISESVGPVVATNADGSIAISGSPTVGEILTATITDDNGATGPIVYEWSSSAGGTIAGATGSNYTLTTNEENAQITVSAVYTDDDGYSESPVSVAVGPVIAANVSGSVAISGTTTEGETLTATVTDANGTTTSSITYQWLADSVSISGANSATYTLTANEVDTLITVSAAYTDDDSYSETPVSSAVGPVTALVGNSAGTIAISGTPTQGETLTATVTDANGTATSSITYQWLADSVSIPSATNATYTLTASEVDALVTVSAAYTDDDSYSETPVSDAVGPIAAPAANAAGTVAISGTPADGETLSAVVTDINGYDAMTVTYQWASDSADITGAIGETFVPGATEVGTEITVTATYTDDDGFAESPSSDAVGPVTGGMFSATVTNGDELLTAVEQAAFYTGGALIELDTATGDGYVDMPELLLDTDDMTITLASPLTGADPVITGATCIVFSADNTGIVLDGLIFDDLTIAGGQSCLDDGDLGSIVMDGTANVIRNSEFLGDVADRDDSDLPDGTDYHFVVVSGLDHVIERNEFSGKFVDDVTHSGTAILVNSDAVSGENENTTIQYNLFKDFGFTAAALSAGGAQVIRIGTSDGLDATGTGNHTIQYNRFADIETAASAITIESSENFVVGNTFDLVLGGLTMLDGRANTVTNNIFIGDGAINQYSSINVSPLGHVITDNFTTLTRRWFVQITYDSLANVGNADIIANFGRETVVIANNTSWDARGPIGLDEVSCDSNTILDVDDNLFVQSNVNPSNTRNQSVILDEDWVLAGCALDATSDFDGNHAYVRSGFLSTSERFGATPIFDWNGAAADNTEGTHVADPEVSTIMTAPSADTDGLGVLVEGAGAAAGIGAALSDLDYLNDNATDVGPDTTRAFNDD